MAEFRFWSGAPDASVSVSQDWGGNYSNGIEFFVTETCWLLSMHYYRASTAVLPAHQMRLFEAHTATTGTPIPNTWFSTPIDNPNATGWFGFALPTPIELQPGVRYRAAFVFDGRMQFSPNYWSGPRVSGPLTAPSQSASLGQYQSPTNHTVGEGALNIKFPDQTGSGQNFWIDVTVTDENPFNTPPTANAGADQEVNSGDLVSLDGTASSDAEDGSVAAYSWTVLDDGGTGLTTGDLSGANTATPSFTAPAASGGSAPTPVWSGDFETGDFRQWLVQNRDHNDPGSEYVETYAAQIVTTDVPEGSYAAKFRVDDGDTAAGNNERSEVQGDYPASGALPGEERWYSWYTKFDPQFPSNHSQGWGLVAQWHDISAGGSPPVGWYVDVTDNYWSLKVNIQSSPGVFDDVAVLWSTPLDNGNWHHPEMRIVWSTDPAVGEIELWYDGVQQTFTGGPNVGETVTHIQTLTPGGGGVYFKQGYYRTAAGVETGVVYHDGYKVYDQDPHAGTGPSTITLQLEVTDSGGLTDTDTVVITVSHAVVDLAMQPFTFGFDFTASGQPVRALAWEGSYGFDLNTSMQRVWNTVAAEFAYGVDLDITMQRVWHTPEMEPLTYGFDFNLAAEVGEPPPGLNVYTRRKLYVPAQRRGIRFIVQDILTGEFIEWDLPLMDATISYTLSGSKTISGVIDPEYPRVADLDMRSRGTWIHAEADGQILGSGILQPGSIEGPRLTIDAAGFTSYAHLIPYRGKFSGIQIDPLDVVRHIWGHIQNYPTGNLGVILDDTASTVKIGTPETDQVDFETGAGEQVSFEANGPYLLNWWENTNCGQEIDNLFKECGAEFRELDYWNDDKTDVIHRLAIGYPRIGKRQPRLKFAQDENIRELIPLVEDDELGCSEVIVSGAGEGATTVQGSYIGTPNGRLRVPILVEDSTITRAERARAFAEEEYLRRQATEGVDAIVIDIHDENAKLGTFAEGDDILVQGEIAYRGRIALWHRIMDYDYNTEEGTATLSLRRSDTFRYG